MTSDRLISGLIGFTFGILTSVLLQLASHAMR